MLDVTVTGEAELSKRLENLAKQQGNLDEVLRVFSQRIFDAAFDGANRHSKGGMLVRSLGTGAKPIDRGYEISHDLQAAPQALFVNFGTRPHDIKPKDKKALRWVNGGKFFFSKFVKHPGYAGDPYFHNALQNVLRNFNQIVKENWQPLKD